MKLRRTAGVSSIRYYLDYFCKCSSESRMASPLLIMLRNEMKWRRTAGVSSSASPKSRRTICSLPCIERECGEVGEVGGWEGGIRRIHECVVP